MGKFKETSMGAIFQNRVQEYGEKTLVKYKNAQGVWEELSWSMFNGMVRNVGMFLINRNIRPGDTVALFSPNRYEWWIADLSIISVGAVNVPIYATNSPEECRYIIENSDSTMCFVGNREHMDKIFKIKNKVPKLREIIIFDDLDTPVPGVITFQDACKEGEAATNKDEFDKRLDPISIEDVATIIYTSGTTGNPKGVMLTHKNFVSNVSQIQAVDPVFISGDHTFLSFLPLAHSFERVAGYYCPIFFGYKVAFAESMEKLLENFREIRPTLLVSVPRIYEKIHTGIKTKVACASPFKKAVFNWAMNIAKRNLPYVCESKARTGMFAFKYFLADKLVFSKLRVALGMDKLYAAVSGGAPLSISDAKFFLGIGVRIVEGFGLTETTPVTNVNKPKRIKPGTVGPALKDTIIKVSDVGEILVKGPQVMKGYYKNEAATKEAFTSDGFFRTGDIGKIDEDGYLTITGRMKDIIITSGGKNISPQNIENTLIACPFIEQVAVIGDKRKYLSALIVPSYASLEVWAKKHNITFTSRKDLISKVDVQRLFEAEIAQYMKDYSRVEQIRKFTLLETEWSQTTGELTPTMKLKRKIINRKYKSQIESMYPPE